MPVVSQGENMIRNGGRSLLYESRETPYISAVSNLDAFFPGAIAIGGMDEARFGG